MKGVHIMEKAKLIDCWNDFYKERFDEVCKELEQGERVKVYIDCIGHTRNNMAQEAYKRALVKKYGERLIVKISEGACSYSYSYSLTE